MPARALLLVAEGLLGEGGAFLREQAAADAGGSVPDERLARRVVLLIFALRCLAASLQRHRRGREPAPAVERCLAHVRHDLALLERLLGTLRAAGGPLDAAARLSASRALPLSAACRHVRVELRAVAALARSADHRDLSAWALRRARAYFRRDGAGASTTRTRSRGTSARTRSAKAVKAAMRG
jgi:hypothetical protein